MLDLITPVVLTFDEAANIGRCLENLVWAKRVVVIDSFSSDATPAIARSFANVRFLQNNFVDPATQLNFALDSGAIETPWILRMDADFMVPDALRAALAGLESQTDFAAFLIPFRYAIFGRRLRATLYPALPLLARRAMLRYRQDGHAEKALIDGSIGRIGAFMVHDDRKLLDRWLRSQWRYMEAEADKLRASGFAALDWPDRIRKTRLLGAPAIFFYCLIAKGLMLDGWAGMFYTLQRVTAELILSLCLIERDLRVIMSAGHDHHSRH